MPRILKTAAQRRGRANRLKGGRVERELAKKLMAAGIVADKVPLSGAMGGSWSGDIRIQFPDKSNELIAEVKARAGGFKMIDRWLGNNDILILKANYKEPQVVLPWDVFTFLLRKGQPNK